MSATPALLCLDIRRERIRESDAELALACMHDCLERARQRSWLIIHLMQPPAPGAGPPLGPIAGLEPLAQEIVVSLTRGAAFESADFHEAVAAYQIARFYLIGCAYSRMGLATIFSAWEKARSLTLIADACVSEGAVRAISEVAQHGAPALSSAIDIDLSARVFAPVSASVINLDERRKS